MNEKEKRDFYIATCKCCLLADAMKLCSTCRFNIGLLARQVELVVPTDLPEPVPNAVFVIAGQYALDNIS